MAFFLVNIEIAWGNTIVNKLFLLKDIPAIRNFMPAKKSVQSINYILWIVIVIILFLPTQEISGKSSTAIPINASVGNYLENVEFLISNDFRFESIFVTTPKTPYEWQDLADPISFEQFMQYFKPPITLKCNKITFIYFEQSKYTSLNMKQSIKNVNNVIIPQDHYRLSFHYNGSGLLSRITLSKSNVQIDSIVLLWSYENNSIQTVYHYYKFCPTKKLFRSGSILFNNNSSILFDAINYDSIQKARMVDTKLFSYNANKQLVAYKHIRGKRVIESLSIAYDDIRMEKFLKKNTLLSRLFNCFQLDTQGYVYNKTYRKYSLPDEVETIVFGPRHRKLFSYYHDNQDIKKGTLKYYVYDSSISHYRLGCYTLGMASSTYGIDDSLIIQPTNFVAKFYENQDKRLKITYSNGIGDYLYQSINEPEYSKRLNKLNLVWPNHINDKYLYNVGLNRLLYTTDHWVYFITLK